MGDARLVNMRGWVPAVNPASLPVDVWPNLNVYPFLVAAELIDLDSTDANDTAAGTGVQTVRIRGLSATLLHQTEIVILDGLTAVPTLLTYARVNSVESVTVGSGGRNAGRIEAVGDASGTLTSRIEIGLGRSLDFIYTVADGRTLWIHSFSLKSTNAVSDSVLRTRRSTLMSRSLSTGGVAAPGPFLALYNSLRNIDSAIVDQRFDPPMIVQGPADLRCELPAAAFQLNATTFDAHLSGWEMFGEDVPPPLQGIRATLLPPSQG